MSDDRKSMSTTANDEAAKQQRTANANTSDTSSDANGMTTEFNHTPHSSDREDGWITSAWQKLRRVLGL